MTPAPNKILIIAPAWVGDMIMAQSLFKIIKQRNPDYHIHVLAGSNLHPLLARMPEVEKIITSPFDHGELRLRDRYRLAVQLRAEHYGEAIVLPNSFKSALIPFLAKIGKRTGWRGEYRYILLNNQRILYASKLPLMVQRFAALGIEAGDKLPEAIPRPELIISRDSVKATLEKLQLPKPKKPILAICPGAEYGSAKRWPAEHFAEIAKCKAKEDWDIWLFGGSKDHDVAAEIQKLSGNVCVDLTGKINLGEAADLLSLAKVVITNDTGLMHVAAALDRPIVAIYGSSSPKFTPPLTGKVKILSLGLSCSPCFKRECPLGHLDCLMELKPEIVLKAITEITK